MYNFITLSTWGIGTALFFGKWYIMNMNKVLHKANVAYLRKYIFTIAFAILFTNIVLHFQDTPQDYDSELEIQRSVERNATSVGGITLGLALFIKGIFTFINNNKGIRKIIRYPIIFVSIGFMYTLFVMFYINIPKNRNAVYIYRNIISVLTNLSIMNIMTGVILFLALIH
jgi:hypothetical protein